MFHASVRDQESNPIGKQFQAIIYLHVRNRRLCGSVHTSMGRLHHSRRLSTVHYLCMLLHSTLSEHHLAPVVYIGRQEIEAIKFMF
jgi:hypothetical protein